MLLLRIKKNIRNHFCYFLVLRWRLDENVEIFEFFQSQFRSHLSRLLLVNVCCAGTGNDVAIQRLVLFIIDFVTQEPRIHRDGEGPIGVCPDKVDVFL